MMEDGGWRIEDRTDLSSSILDLRSSILVEDARDDGHVRGHLSESDPLGLPIGAAGATSPFPSPTDRQKTPSWAGVPGSRLIRSRPRRARPRCESTSSP